MNFFSLGLFAVAFASFAQHAATQDTAGGTCYDTSGFEQVFRYPSYAGVDILSYFDSGCTDPSQDLSSLTATQVKFSQMFRSDNLHEKLAGAKEIVLVIYDAAGVVAETLIFRGTGHQKSWFDRNNLVSTTNWEVTAPFNYFSIDGHGGSGRRFYINRSWGGCPNDYGWFVVSCGNANGSPACTNYETVPDQSICKIMYTTINKQGRYGTDEIAVASAMEIYTRSNLAPVFGLDRVEKVFRYPNYAGVDVLSYFDSGCTDPSQDLSSLTATEVKHSDMFRSDNLHEKLAGAKEIVVVIYDASGSVAETLVFKGNGDNKSWFGRNNLISATNWEVTAPFNFFSINGHDGSGRRFYINRSWGGCPNDYGWFVVSCGKANGSPACTNYETVPDQKLCKILYSTTDKQGRFGTNEIAEASAMEIQIRPYLGSVPGIEGYEKIFRYPNYAGVDVLKYFESGNTDGFQVGSSFSNVKIEDMFRGPNFDQRMAEAEEVMLVVYDTQGGVAQKLVFNGNTEDKKSWLSKDNLISASSWDLTGNFNYYSVDGHAGSGRRFYINNRWGGCPNDYGWLVVSCGKDNGSPACTNWEQLPSGEYYCSILYSTISGAARFGTNQVSLGSAIEILIKPGQ